VVLPLTRKERRERARAQEHEQHAATPPDPKPGLLEGWLDFVGLG
jgi:hypothetical protein